MSETRWHNNQPEPIEPQPIDVLDFVIVGLTVARGMVQAVLSGVNMTDYIVRSWSNHRRDQREFAANVASTIERI